jgi:hypothetical protein
VLLLLVVLLLVLSAAGNEIASGFGEHPRPWLPRRWLRFRLSWRAPPAPRHTRPPIFPPVVVE